jgi:hypothetical protein
MASQDLIQSINPKIDSTEYLLVIREAIALTLKSSERPGGE